MEYSFQDIAVENSNPRIDVFNTGIRNNLFVAFDSFPEIRDTFDAIYRESYITNQDHDTIFIDPVSIGDERYGNQTYERYFGKNPISYSLEEYLKDITVNYAVFNAKKSHTWDKLNNGVAVALDDYKFYAEEAPDDRISSTAYLLLGLLGSSMMQGYGNLESQYNFHSDGILFPSLRELGVEEEILEMAPGAPSKPLLFGHYFPDRNILIMPLWYFRHPVVRVMASVLSRLIRDGIIKRVQPKPVGTIMPEKITVGADPEFEKLRTPDSYRVISANNDDEVRDILGSQYDDEEDDEYFEADPYTAEFGLDGAATVVEIRPRYQEDPVSIVAEIKRIITEYDVPLSVAGNVYAAGCHIHFGFDPETVSKVVSSYDTSRKVAEYIRTVLNYYLGRLMYSLNGSARGYYASLDDCLRSQSYGYEYRALPAAVLHHPKIATIVFKLAYTVITKLTKDKVEIPDERDVATREEIEELIGKEDTAYLYNFLEWYPEEYDGSSITRLWKENWTIPEKWSISPVKVYYRETWEHDVIEQLIKPFIEELTRESGFDEHHRAHLIFRGYAATRGNVLGGIYCVKRGTTLSSTVDLYDPALWNSEVIEETGIELVNNGFINSGEPYNYLFPSFHTYLLRRPETEFAAMIYFPYKLRKGIPDIEKWRPTMNHLKRVLLTILGGN